MNSSFRRASRNLNAGDDSDQDDNDMSSMASPTKLYSKEKPSRGRSTEAAGEGGRSSSRSRSRSSSVLRKILGGTRKGKKRSDDGMSVASGMSMASVDTKSTKIKRIKKIKRLNDDKSVRSDASFRDDDTLPEDEPRKRSSSRDRARPSRSSSTDRAQPKRSSSRRKRSSSSDPARPKRSSSTDRARPKRSCSSDRVRTRSMQEGPIPIDEDLSESSLRDSPLSKKIDRKNKLKYKSRDSGSVVSDGNYGAADSDDDNGSTDGRSVGSEAILSPRSRKIRRKRRPKKPGYDDDDTVGSSKVSLADSYSSKTPKASSSRRVMHEERVASIPEPPLSPDGANILDEMDNLLPSSKSEKKKLLRVKRKGKQDPPLPPSGARERPPFSPIVDRTPGARPSDYRNGNEAAAAVLVRMSKSGKGDPPLVQQSQYHDSGLTTDSIPQEAPSSNRSNRSLRSSARHLGDNDTVLSMTDTVSSLNKQLDEQREETKDLRKQLTEALTKIASLNEELRHGETSGLNEKADLLKSLNDMREDSIAKDDRIDKLQQVVETQLDTIEFLEEKLEQTEDELLKVEDELKELDDGGLLDQSVHTKNMLKRKGSIRQEKVTRKGSIQARNEESRSILRSDGSSTKRSREDSNMDDLDEREAKVVAREIRLDEWEKNLVKFDIQIKNSRKNGEEEAAFQAKLQLMEKRERRMEENRDALVQEKEALVSKIQRLESGTNMPASIAEESPMDEDTNALKRSISELETENQNLLVEVADMKKAKKEDAAAIAELESVKQDLLVKLDHVRSTAIRDEQKHQQEITSLENELKLYQNAEEGDGTGIGETIRVLKEEIAEKETTIQELGDKLKTVGSADTECDDEGKDMLIRELQNQLVTAKKEAHDCSSGDYVKRLKVEIKTLKQGYNELKKRMKKTEVDAQAELKKKEDALKSMERAMAKQKRELERLEKREKNLGTGGSIEEEGLKKHIEDLEDEIDHWKATNADLENELDLLKSEFSEWKREGKDEDGDVDDDLSVGSLQSLNSHMSESELFFISDSNSVRSNRSISTGIPPPPGEEPSTPSQRALRSVSKIWSKMKSEPAGAPPPIATPYGAGMLDDD